MAERRGGGLPLGGGGCRFLVDAFRVPSGKLGGVAAAHSGIPTHDP